MYIIVCIEQLFTHWTMANVQIPGRVHMGKERLKIRQCGSYILMTKCVTTTNYYDSCLICGHLGKETLEIFKCPNNCLSGKQFQKRPYGYLET
jgi:hypothetical protein